MSLRHLVFGKASISAEVDPRRSRTALIVLQLAHRTCRPSSLPSALMRSYMLVPARPPREPHPSSRRCSAPLFSMWSSASASKSALYPQAAHDIVPFEYRAMISRFRLKRYTDLARLYCSRFLAIQSRFNFARAARNAASPIFALYLALYSLAFGSGTNSSFPVVRQG